MKRMTKILTASLAAATLASFAVAPVFSAHTVYTDNWVCSDYVAADTSAGTPEVPGTARLTLQDITVTKVNDTSASLEVVAYQIVKGTYKDNKLTGYVLCDNNLVINDIKAPTATEITTIANQIGAGTVDLHGIKMKKQTDPNNTTFQARVEAGLYIVLVKDADAVVYNPAIVAVNVSDANAIDTSATGGTVDMTSYFNTSTNAYLKASEPNVNKDITDASGVSLTNAEGQTVAFGDTVYFKVESMVPSYSDDYVEGSIVYKITDKMDKAAFKGVDSLTVKVAAEADMATAQALPAVTENDPTTTDDDFTNYTLTFKDKNGQTTTNAADAVEYEISFSDAFVRQNGEKAVKVTYSSTIQNTAGVNYAENKNTATLTYSNDPTDTSGAKTKDDSTYHYTFGIDADLDGQSESTIETYELNKVTRNGETFTEKTLTSSKTTKASPVALQGAGFTLYSDEAMTQVVATATSDVNGHIKFEGLDQGTYYLKETTAPTNYSLSEKNYRVVISATINNDGVLTAYSITTAEKNDDQYTTVGSATYTNTPTINADGTVTNVIDKTNVTAAEILNTQLAALPSTGGVGTIIITVVAALGMAGFLAIFVISRKKRKNSAE